ncbi:MAG TPA: chemotaxis protein CheW [Candidatus Binatia bacterium]|nr:chemotaxis protein CheW [Candidatus Binatia bacterium]
MSGPDASWLIRFHVGGAEAALPLRVVREVVARPTVVPVPGSHSFVSGVALLGGVALPVYDLRAFRPFWSAAVPDRGGPTGEEGEHLIVCDWGEARLGLLGDRVDLLEQCGQGAGLEDATEDRCAVSRAFVRDVVRRDEEAVVLLDPVTLFASLGVPAAGPPRAMEGAGEDDPAGG